MNALIENGYIQEMACGSDFSYILSDNSSFMSTEYKVLQSQANRGFVKCMKMLYNGKIQLYYLTGSCKTFASLFPVLDADSFMVVCANLFADIINVKNNGFLNCRNIDISFEKIYVDTATYKVSLVYLPVAQRLFDDYYAFENELRTSLVKLIHDNPVFPSQKATQFGVNLSDGTLSIENIYALIKNGAVPSQNKNKQRHMKLVAMNIPNHVEIPITKDNFTIGKKAQIVDGVVSFNKMISRLHCKITNNGTDYFITDLQSSNGTYVNSKRLQPNQPYPVNQGDIVRLANTDFQVVVE